MAYTLHEDNSDDSYSIAGGAYGTWYLCQTFTASSSYALKKIDLPLCKEGTPPQLYVELWSASGGEPNSLLISHTVVATLPTYPSHDWTEFVFGSAQSVVSGTQYAIVVKSDGTGDSDNRGRWWYDSTGSLGGGQEGWSNDSGSNWNMYSAPDHLIKTYSVLATPEKPVTPDPSDASTTVTLDQATLTWEDGGNADTYNVYFGTTGNMTLQSEAQVGVSWGLTSSLPFSYNTEYQWRIDATNDSGTTTGDTWSFTTIAFAPPAVSSSNPNAFQVIRRLAVAAYNKFWYEDL